MVVRIARDAKDNHDFRVERGTPRGGEIRADVEAKAVDSLAERRLARHEIRNATIAVRRAASHHGVVARPLERDADTDGGFSERGVQHVCADRAHDARSGLKSFSSLRRVIFRCSSAATRSSLSGSLPMRSLASDNISSADFPLAHTIKM